MYHPAEGHTRGGTTSYKLLVLVKVIFETSVCLAIQVTMTNKLKIMVVSTQLKIAAVHAGASK